MLEKCSKEIVIFKNKLKSHNHSKSSLFEGHANYSWIIINHSTKQNISSAYIIIVSSWISKFFLHLSWVYFTLYVLSNILLCFTWWLTKNVQSAISIEQKIDWLALIQFLFTFIENSGIFYNACTSIYSYIVI